MKQDVDFNGKSLDEWRKEYPGYLHVIADHNAIVGRFEPGEVAPYGYWAHKGKEPSRWVNLLRTLFN